jgi:hypothetical protein
MSIPTPEFDDAFLTTRTLLYGFGGSVDLEGLAQTLPLVPVAFDRPWKRGTRPKISAFPAFGTIYSVRYGPIVRGVFGLPFKNSVMIDFSIGTKSVNVKVSKKSIHICGIQSVEAGLRLAELVLEYARTAQRHLDVMAPLWPAVKAWVLTHTLGPVREIPKYVVTRELVKDKWKTRRYEQGTETVTTFVPFDSEMLSVATGLPVDTAVWFSKLLVGLRTHAEVAEYLPWFDTRRTLVGPEGLTLDPEPHQVMINCSYSLGFPIRKEALKAICDARTDFIAQYNNAVHYYVTVEKVCTPEEMKGARVLVSRKKKLAVHTFIVYDSGHVMQSSKIYDAMKDAFYRFRELIQTHRAELEDTEAAARTARLVKK